MMITQDDAGKYWKGNRDYIERSYFEMGFDKAIELIGTCFECEYKNKIECPLKDYISKVDLNNYYCASFKRR